MSIELEPEDAEGLADELARHRSDRGFRELAERIYSILDVFKASDREQVK
ncbi:hypothetical protein SCB71_06375 [Herbiconiux sp. KACC 21604]|nr:hypothetical protein [Herbiconiux sp. SALV-R1]QJU52942.1 hypothetical protein HL652_04360 [Herbiconiux sp. SALV-R1]WPO87864.1 hypothetical protein SCB71_06375 [Herbiconiux sp. KACC 21604]